MLTDEQLEILSEPLIPLFQYLEHEIIVDVANRIKETMAYSHTAELQAIAMRELGYSPAKIRAAAMKILNADAEYRKQVAKNTLEHKRTIRKMINDIQREACRVCPELIRTAAGMEWHDDLTTWKQAGKELTDSSYLPQLVKAFQEQTAAELQNLTQTTGFKTMSGFEASENLYRRELDKATIKLCSGTFGREKVIEDTVKSLAESGLRTIDFSSGYSMQLDTAVRNAVRTGCHQIAGKVTDQNILSSGENLVYVSKHWGARNKGIGHANHEQWQGQVYFIKPGHDYSEEAERIGQGYITDLWRATGYSVDGEHENDPLGLDGYNCRHNRYVWFKGISEFPADDPEPEPKTINGKEYDYYAMTQKMRSMERNMRALKREREALKAMNMDTKAIETQIKRKTADYKDFCDKCGIKPKTERMRYQSGTSDVKKTKAWKKYSDTVKEYAEKPVADSPKHDTMVSATEEKGVDVHTVGRINRDIYKCITEDIVTDEVIITDERIRHIQERHPEDYERFCEYLKVIVEYPDYIVETNKPNTALILKEIVESSEKQFKTVLRLTTSVDNPDFKNSIITFMKIDEKEWKRLLKNKQILYKRE